MNLTRSMRALAFVATLLFVAIVVAVVVSTLADPISSAIVLVVALAAYGVWRAGSRRVRRGTVLELDFDRGLVEQPPVMPIDRAASAGTVVLRDAVDALLRGAEDERVDGVIARLGNGRIGVAQAQELRDAVARFRASGKRSVAFAEDFGEGSLATVDYYVAAAFEEIHLQPVGNLSIQGLLARTPFLGSLLDKLDITADLDHRREYKAAKYVFTETDFVPPHEESVTALLEEHLDQVVSGIAADRRLDPGVVRGLIDSSPLTGPEALEAGLVDQISFRDQAYEAAGAAKNALLFPDHYLKRAGRLHRKGERVALVYGTGTITRGKSRFDPLERGSSFGADEVAQALRQARDDAKVKAIVFRVDSPGGSAVASELVRREVVRSSEEGKPVVVSMGNVAASGGYFVSTHADRIVAQPGTVTGSIGVVAGKLARAAAWQKIGIDWRTIKLGRNATFGAPDHPFTDTERARLSASLDTIYADFKARVSDGRAIDPERVEEIAKGRVWTGARAHELGLVDELGGVERAVELAMELAEIPVEKGVDLRIFPMRRPVPFPARKESSEPVRAFLESVLDGFDHLTGRVGDPVFELRMPFDFRW